ncbi:calmodulin-binding-domain-containing protein [Globomyces pollinis-pini]|nr:calmodulin-binding-domain-containing protein [Globomyces pollinis-pini]
MSEARKTHQKHMSGVAVGMLLKPSKGVRDDLLRAGLTPKNHMKENVKQMRLKEAELKRKKLEAEKPQKDPFILNQFRDIPSRLSTRTPSKTSTPTPTKNYIALNVKQVKSAPSSCPPSIPPTPSGAKDRRGELPRYLIERKLQWAKREQERLMELEKEKIPKGQILLPDEDRIRTLNALKTKRDELLKTIRALPLVIELPSLKKRKSDMEDQLIEIEAGIQMFTRSKVYIPEDQYDALR